MGKGKGVRGMWKGESGKEGEGSEKQKWGSEGRVKE